VQFLGTNPVDEFDLGTHDDNDKGIWRHEHQLPRAIECTAVARLWHEYHKSTKSRVQIVYGQFTSLLC
jgi:hypothetical protein